MSGLRNEYQAHDSDNEPNVIHESGEDNSENAESSVDTTSDKIIENDSSGDDNFGDENKNDVEGIIPEASTENGAPSLETSMPLAKLR